MPENSTIRPFVTRYIANSATFACRRVGRYAAERSHMRSAGAKVRSDPVIFDDELDAAPAPVRKGVEQIRQIGDPCGGPGRQVSAPHRGIEERADRIEVVAIARVEVVGVPLAHLPGLHSLIIRAGDSGVDAAALAVATE